MKIHLIHSIPPVKSSGINLTQKLPVLLLIVSIFTPLSSMAEKSFKWTGPDASSLTQATQKFAGGPAQWKSVGGKKAIDIEHRFENHWIRGNRSKPNGPWWNNNDDQKNPPARPNSEVVQDVVVKKGTITVKGPGFLAAYRHYCGHNEGRNLDHGIILRDVEDLKNPWSFSLQSLGDSRCEKNTKWIGVNGPAIDPKHVGGRIPEGKTMTFNIMAQSIPQTFLYDRWGYGAPKFARMSIWWFPGEGGKLISVTPHGQSNVINPPDDPGDPDKPLVIHTGGESLAPVADSYVYAYNYRNWNRCNWGAYEKLGAGYSPVGGYTRAYLKFDVSQLKIPAGKRVKLRLYHNHTAGGHTTSLGVYRLTSPWKEGQGTYHSGVVEQTANPGEISWLQQPSINGGQVAKFNPGSGINKYVEVDITDLVKTWKSGQANYGLVIAPMTTEGGGNRESAYGFYSREYKDAAKRPALIIGGSGETDLPPPPPPTGTLQVRADQKQVQKGQTFYVPVWLDFPKSFPRTRDGRINAANLNVEISYNPNILKAGTKIMPGNVLGGALFQSNPRQPGIIKLGFATKKGIQNSGTLAQLIFQAVGQPGQRSPLSVRVTQINDDQGRRPQTKVVHGYISILKEGVIGDINGNGIVDAGDALSALKMSVGLEPQNMILNVDKKDQVTSNDARLLLQMAVQGGTTVPTSSKQPISTSTKEPTKEPTVAAVTTADARRAYQEYIAAYNKLTSLMAKGQGDTPAVKTAHAAYKVAKEKYEAAIKNQPPAKRVE